MRRQILIITFFLTISVALCRHLYAWENIKTHPALTEKAVGSDNSAAKIDDYLKTQLGLDEGIETELEYLFLWSLKKRMAKADPRLEGQARFGAARYGWVWQGAARLGMVVYGEARLGRARQGFF